MDWSIFSVQKECTTIWLLFGDVLGVNWSIFLLQRESTTNVGCSANIACHFGCTRSGVEDLFAPRSSTHPQGHVHGSFHLVFTCEGL